MAVPERGEMLAMIDDVPRDAKFQVGAHFRSADGKGCWRIAGISLMGPPPGAFAVELIPLNADSELLEGMILEMTENS